MWMTYGHRISESTRHGGRQRREILGIRSSVRQRSARSSPLRRRKLSLPERLTFYILFHSLPAKNWLNSGHWNRCRQFHEESISLLLSWNAFLLTPLVNKPLQLMSINQQKSTASVSQCHNENISYEISGRIR